LVNEHGRYVRDSKSKDNKKQSRFDKSGWLQPVDKEVEVVFTGASINEQVMCPFCLYQAKLSAFFISNKKGISQTNAHCPDCNHDMRMKSLWNNWGAKEYAEWVFDYRHSGFWQKCPFAKWKERLHKIGWAHEFWTRYKELKGADTTDSYFEHMEKEAQEYANAQYKEYEESQV
jgi:hypothetical protein